MAKQIVIKENDTNKTLYASRLETNLAGGGTCTWIPEDETQQEAAYVEINTHKFGSDN